MAGRPIQWRRATGGSAHPGRHELWTLYAAGFITAFGAHAVAANLGGHATGRHASLVELGVLLAVCDGAEIVLKPAFGHISDRVGPRPVLIGGLVGFALASAAFVLAGEPDALDLARLSQGASSAAAFSPAAASMVAAMGGPRARGRSFGGYGAAKGSATWAGQPSEVVWSWSAATPCSSSCSPPLPAQWP